MAEKTPVSQVPAIATTFPEIVSLGEMLAKSGYFTDVRSAAQAVVKILAGRELGFGPIASLNGVHVIEGKPSVGAHLMASLIKRSGRYDYRIVRLDKEVCELEFSTKNGTKFEVVGKVSYTHTEAVESGIALGRDGKLKANWRRTPDDMLFARAVSKGYRRFCPDLSSGLLIYTTEEMEQQEQTETPRLAAPSEPTPDVVAQPKQLAAPTVPVIEERINDAQLGELTVLIRETGTDVARVLEHYKVQALQQLPTAEFNDLKRILEKKPKLQTTAASEPVTACITAAQQAELEKQLVESKMPGADWLRSLDLTEWKQLPQEWFLFLRTLFRRGADLHMTEEILGKKALKNVPTQRLENITRSNLMGHIDQLTVDLHISKNDWDQRLTDLFGTTDTTKLTLEQLGVLESRLWLRKAEPKRGAA